ncbi:MULTISPECIES: exodeoxyribonuclease III [unclassified Campylobacter]|uniref:exodeoxyribonuclease III n=1 Tax=unclassified Campylobacter TaxID=2593542 RepID=UPI001BD94127|nr:MULTISPECIES: exodeoxyribonuclease III [unclassified Campylobacter]MBZ7978667.1 exodeoxyribonuclease III [Campylobacter sp. RM12654]MBZ7980170.1 exodeoxyribonuclease III [Campylobacter sp. RM12642]MBZ7981895.1 exodeoxyribonuclease III [Campylobacter sp. RM12640]MBZ7989198.1 exodeoxyribonuclease III [Campylobacter sp. RM12635]MBZ7991120.1 exodeoxyribonuclease III [Campylobacter sp. RM9331]MBZ7992267.1 exodeoxyribonuclease III [Campylobacter sp. RM9333]MBZ8005613.1 exodeoxyribonuclease III 
MRLISWNVNGLRAICDKDGFSFLEKYPTDFLGIQEIKATPDKFPKDINNLGFKDIKSNSAKRAGYSGVMSFLNFECESRFAQFFPDDEGRVLEHSFKDIVLFNIYFPNGQSGDERLDYKMKFYDDFLEYLKKLLLEGKKIIICGDVNTAHRPIDLTHPKANEKTSGFLPIEREWIDRLLDAGFVDTFRYINGDIPEKYSWWSYRAAARNRNVGWRIDYFFISNNLTPYLKDAFILSDVMGSDHCPVGIDIEI